MLDSVRLGATLVAIVAAVTPVQAMAYIGPGAGLGAIAIFVAVILGVFLLLVGLVWYPLKRLIKGKNGRTSEITENEESQ